jgi:biopolymer transport protein ExbB
MSDDCRVRRAGQVLAFLSRRRGATEALAVVLLILMSIVRSALAQDGPGAPAAPSAVPAASAPVANSEPQQITSTMKAAGDASPKVESAPTTPEVPGAAQPQLGELSINRTQLPQDLSPWGMFLKADLVVKAVIGGLVFASLVTWTVWLAKIFELRGARAEVRRGLKILGAVATLAEAHGQLSDGTSAVAQFMQAAADEIRLSAGMRGEGLKERIAWQLQRLESAISRKISRGTGILATIGSTAPFVGLFGTVWGIMNSFIGISNAHTTNLAVVAPGIAQALLATALGLVAAIPAVMIYNVLTRATMHYRALLGDANAQTMQLLSRDIDRAGMSPEQATE